MELVLEGDDKLMDSANNGGTMRYFLESFTDLAGVELLRERLLGFVFEGR